MRRTTGSFAGWGMRLLLAGLVPMAPGARSQSPPVSSATPAAPPEFVYLAAGLSASPFGEGPEGRVTGATRPSSREGLILNRQGSDYTTVEFGLLRAGAVIVRLAEVRGERASIAADGEDTLWLSVTGPPVGDPSGGGVARWFKVRGLASLAGSPSKKEQEVGGVPGVALTTLAEGVTARLVAEYEQDPSRPWEAIEWGEVTAESRLGLVQVRTDLSDEFGPLRGRGSIEVTAENGVWHPIADLLLPWTERDGTVFQGAVADPSGAVWVSAGQRRGDRQVTQWLRIDGVRRALEDHRGVRPEPVSQWSGSGYPPQQLSAFKPLLPGLTVKLVASCSDVRLSGATVSTAGLVVADKGSHSDVTLRLLTDDGKERDLLHVANMPDWSIAVDFDDVLWIQTAPYQAGSMGSFRDCRQVWRVDGLRAAASPGSVGAP